MVTSKHTSRALNKLLREFNPLTQNPQSSVSAGTTIAEDFTSTFLVAASDARIDEIAIAQYVCDGVNDEVEIQAAIDSFGASPTGTVARIQLSTGHFEIAAPINIPWFQGIEIAGEGIGATRISDDGTTTNLFNIGFVDFAGPGTLGFSDMTVDLTSGQDSRFIWEDSNSDARQVWIERINVRNGHLLYVEDSTQLDDNSYTISDCHVLWTGGSAQGGAIYLNVGQSTRVNISNCTLWGDHSGLDAEKTIYIRHGSWSVTGCVINGDCTFDYALGGTFVGNTVNQHLSIPAHLEFNGPAHATESLHFTIAGNTLKSGVSITCDGLFGGVIAANNWYNAGGAGATSDYAIRLDSCVGVNVVSNTMNGVTGFDAVGDGRLIELFDSDDCSISENVIVLIGPVGLPTIIGRLGADDTYDCIHLSGDSDRNTIKGNRVNADQQLNEWRYGLNISAATCNDNRVTHNFLTSVSGVDGINDDGTGTVLHGNDSSGSGAGSDTSAISRQRRGRDRGNHGENRTGWR